MSSNRRSYVHLKEVTTAADLYSLGAILYELLTGRPPFQEPTVAATLQKVLNAEPALPRSLNPAVPRDLETICLRCLEKEPARRYRTALELAEDLEHYTRNEPIAARPATVPERAWRWCRRKPALAATLAALVFVFMLGIAGVLWQWQRAEDHAKKEGLERQRAELNAASEARERRRADTNALAEAQQRKLAVTSAAQSKDRLVRLHVANGTRLLEEGDSVGSLAWFAQALNLVRDEPDKTSVHQLRLQSVLHHCPRLLQMWFHGGAVNSAVFSSDGRFVVTASADQTARVWEVETGQPVTPPLPHAGPVKRAVFSPDGGRVLAAAWMDVRVWDARTGETNLVLPHALAEDAVFSPDGQWIVSASADQTIKVWDARSGRERAPALTHADRSGADNYTRHLFFSPDGGRLMTASYGNMAQVWDWEKGEPIVSLSHNQTVRHAEFSPDGTLIATANWANTAHLWDATTGREVVPPLPQGGMTDHVTFSPDGKWLVSVGGGGSIKVWDVKTGNLIRSSTGNELVMESVFSPDGSLLMTRQLDGRVRIRSAQQGEMVAPPLRHSWWATAAQFHPDGRRVLTASVDGTVRLWDLEAGSLQFWPWPEEQRMHVVGWSPRRTRLLTENASGRLQSWDVQTWRADALALAPTNEVGQAFYSEDDRRVLTVSKLFRIGSNRGLARELELWDLASGARLHGAQVPFAQSPSGPQLMTVSPDGTRVVLAADGAVEAWDVVAGKQLWRTDKHTLRNGLLHFSPDARQLTVVCGALLHVMNAETGRQVYRDLTNHLVLYAAPFSPDGRWLATVDSDSSYRDGEARIWEAATGKLRHALQHADGVACAAFSPDGRWLATGGESGEARVFDVETGQPVSSRLRHEDGVGAIAFSHDGRFLATGTAKRTAQVWDVATSEPVTPPLKHPRNVEEVFFLAGNRALVTRCGNSFRFWRLEPKEQSLAELQAQARVLAAHDLDSSGTMVALDVTTLSNSWSRWQRAVSENVRLVARQSSPMPALLLKPQHSSALFPERDPEAKRNLLDLTMFYDGPLTENLASGRAGNNLAEVPTGLQTFGGVGFDVRGIIQLQSSQLKGHSGHEFREAVKGIGVGARFSRLHALLGTGGNETNGHQVATFILHYPNGEEAGLPIVYERHVRDWTSENKGENSLSPDGIAAWTGQNRVTRATGGVRRLYRATWTNPRPTVEVESIEFVSALTRCAPFLIAITVD